jgi:hypothetical protein
VYINNNKTILGALSSTLIAVLFLEQLLYFYFFTGHFECGIQALEFLRAAPALRFLNADYFGIFLYKK